MTAWPLWLAFGLGTVPAMLGVSLLGCLADTAWRVQLQRFAPVGLGLVGLLLILRGLGLGGMISPALSGAVGPGCLLLAP